MARQSGRATGAHRGGSCALRANALVAINRRQHRAHPLRVEQRAPSAYMQLATLG
jgi:hypothetical protein